MGGTRRRPGGKRPTSREGPEGPPSRRTTAGACEHGTQAQGRRRRHADRGEGGVDPASFNRLAPRSRSPRPGWPFSPPEPGRGPGLAGGAARPGAAALRPGPPSSLPRPNRMWFLRLRIGPRTGRESPKACFRRWDRGRDPVPGASSIVLYRNADPRTGRPEFLRAPAPGLELPAGYRLRRTRRAVRPLGDAEARFFQAPVHVERNPRGGAKRVRHEGLLPG